MKIHYLQHVPFEDIANIGLWLKSRGHQLSGTKFFAGEKPGPEINFDLLVIMGGPMNIYEENIYPWLADEKRFIEKAVAAERCILGICLGAQLIADVLGSRVYKNKHREIGWYPVTLTPQAKNTAVFGNLQERFTAFHWHGDTFDIPPGAVCTAESEACRNQAFEYNKKVIGLQFHLESSRSSIEALVNNCSDELVEGSYIQTPEEIIAGLNHIENLNEIMFSILHRLENLACET